MPEKLGDQRPEKPKQLQEKEKIREDALSPERVLSLSPKELVDLFAELDKKNEVEPFLKRSAENDSLVAMFSYWEKWLEQDHRKLIDQLVAEKKKVYEGEEEKDSLPLQLEKKFTEGELKLIFSHLGGIQLTFGCSKGCPFCGLDAVPGVREHIPYSQLANLFRKYGKNLRESKPLLYWASEPSDYASKVELEDKTYQDAHQLAVEYAGYSPFTSSRETSNKEWLEFLSAHGEGDVHWAEGARVSVFGYTKQRIAQIEEITKRRVGMVGKKRAHKKGIGVSFGIEQETDEQKIRHFADFVGGQGIDCKNGVLITPRGIYNVARIPISAEFPQGQVVTPLEKLSSKEIKAGDNLQDVLRHSIVYGPLDEEGYHDPITESALRANASTNVVHYEYVTFTGLPEKFRKQIDIATQNKLYRVWFDVDGIIHRVAELNPEEEEEVEQDVMVKEGHAAAINQVIAEAIENNKIEIFTNWTDNQVKKILGEIGSADLSSFRYRGKTWVKKISIPQIGNVFIKVGPSNKGESTLYLI